MAKAKQVDNVLEARKLRSQTSVLNSIAILTVAIDEKLSLSESSRQHGYGRNYISDVKARIADNYAKKLIKRDTFNTFKRLLKAYNKL